MQWADEPNAGFSAGPAERLVRPVVSKGAFDYRRINVADQRDLDGSLMSTLQRLVRTRRACPEVGWGRCEVMETGETGVLALRYDWQGETILILHNLADQAADVRLSLDGIDRLRPLFCDRHDRAMRDASDPISLNPYGYRWFRAQGERR